MTGQQTHILAFQFDERPVLGFLDIVEEYDAAFQACVINRRHLTWDCDDVAIFDCTGMRVALGWMEPETTGRPWFLVVALGASPDPGETPVAPQTTQALIERIRARTEAGLPFDALHQSTTDKPIGAALLDAICARLASETVAPAHQPAQSEVATVTEPIAAAPSIAPDAAAPQTCPPRRGAGDAEIGLSEEDDRMRRLREALCGTTDEIALSAPMHLSVYALGATMLLQVPPVGAALLVYTLLREDFGAVA